MMSANFLDKNNDNYDFGKRQKNRQTVIIVLSILGIAIIFFGVWQIRNRIVSPFVLDQTLVAEKTSEKVLGEYIDLVNIDTDGDSLSDYDEQYLYGTSPYLEDTDSDGISDKVEIERGTDPKCPEGQNCLSGNYFAEQSVNSDLSANSSNNLVLTNLNNSEEFTDEELRAMLAGQMDAKVLRAFLLENGVEQTVLDNISDEELLSRFNEELSSSYQEVLNKQNE